MLPQQPVGEDILFMFYNTENLFDIYDDSLTDDDEFLPGGTRRWNNSRYQAKINALYKTIIAVGEWKPPEMVAMCEVENRKVLQDLLYGTYLAKFNYAIVHEESTDERGIDVCLLYNRDELTLEGYKTLEPEGADGSLYRGRSILYAKLSAGTDTLHLFINHWTSKRGGVLAGEAERIDMAKVVAASCDSLYRVSRGKARILVAGDFNCAPEENSLTEGPGKPAFLVNLGEDFSRQGLGTYRYQGRWEMIDQVIVSLNMLNDTEGIYTSRALFRIAYQDFLMRKDPVYPGESPWPTYSGFRYSGGYSDHLPVVLALKRPPGQ